MAEAPLGVGDVDHGGCALEDGDALLQLLVHRLELAGLPVEIGEDGDLRAEDLGDHRHRDVVDGAALVSHQAVAVGHVDGRAEDDRRAPVPRMVADHLGQLESVQVGHAHVGEHHPDLLAEQPLQGLARGLGLDQVLAQVAEDRLVGQ